MDFEEIYKQKFDYIYRYFYYKGVDDFNIEDLIQDVFLIYYKKYSESKLSSVDSLKVLYKIASNLYKDWVKTRVKSKSVRFIPDFFEHDHYKFEDFIDNDFEETRINAIKMLRDLIDKLNPKVKEVLISRFFLNQTRNEVALRLGITENDVHTYQKRGVKYLKKLVEENMLQEHN